MSEDILPDLPVIEPLTIENYELHVDYFLKKDYSDISEASQELPSIIEWVNEKLQGLVELKMNRKQEIKEAEAEAYVYLKNGGFEEEYSGRQTEHAMDHAVVLNPKVKEAHRAYSNCFAWASRLSNLLFVLQAKLDMVRSTEATRRSLVERTAEEVED